MSKDIIIRGANENNLKNLDVVIPRDKMVVLTGLSGSPARLREAGADIWPAYFAGHSLGEYNALSAFADVIPLETVLDEEDDKNNSSHADPK